MRKARKLKDEAMYHITARANRQEFIFKSKVIKDMFIKVLKASRKKFKFQFKNFCIMGNHIHFLLKPEKPEDLSKIMQWILSVFAIRYNKYFSISGHVWYDRFRSKIVDNIFYFINVNRYINENPVKAGLVNKAEDYYYCGLTFIRLRLFTVIDPPDLFMHFMFQN